MAAAMANRLASHIAGFFGEMLLMCSVFKSSFYGETARSVKNPEKNGCTLLSETHFTSPFNP